MKAYYDSVVGERYCRIEKRDLIKYNNVSMNKNTAERFIEHLKLNNLFSIPEVKIYFKRSRLDLFGESTDSPMFVMKLYRHSVSVFIHELAHIIEFFNNENQFSNFHNKAFGQTMSDLFNEYLKEE